jgi:hypothetical protein
MTVNLIVTDDSRAIAYGPGAIEYRKISATMWLPARQAPVVREPETRKPGGILTVVMAVKRQAASIETRLARVSQPIASELHGHRGNRLADRLPMLTASGRA